MKYIARQQWSLIRRSTAVRGWWRLNPVDAVWWSGLRSATGVVTPLIIVVLAGHLALAPAALFGGMTAVHARYEPFRVRGRLLAAVGVGLTTAVALGSAAAALHVPAIWLALLVALVAACAKLLTDAIAVGPPGGLIFVFAFSGALVLPAGWSQVGAQTAVAAFGALFAWCVAMAGSLVDPLGPVRIAVARAVKAVARQDGPRHLALAAVMNGWRALSTLDRETPRSRALETTLAQAESTLLGGSPVERHLLPTTSWSAGIRSALQPGSPEFARALRVFGGAFAAGLLAQALHLGHPYWAAVGASAVLQSTSARHTTERAVQRGLGTVAGALVAAGILALHPPLAVAVGAVSLSVLGAELVVTRNYALTMVFVTPVTLVLSTLGTQVNDAALVSARVVDNLLGAVVGVLVVVLISDRWALDRLRGAISRAQRSSDALSATPLANLARTEALVAVLALRQAWDVLSNEPVDVDADGVAYAELVESLERRCYQLISPAPC